MNKSDKLNIVRDAIKNYPDFPKEGIIFRDIFGVFNNVVAMGALKDLLRENTLLLDVDAVVGLDSRGFLIGPWISIELGKPFVPIRKKGKLPGKVMQQTYKLEYGEDIFEIQTESVGEGKRVIVVDDLLATGGSMQAAVMLLKATGAVVVECLVVIELLALQGRSKIDAPVDSIVQYD